MLTHTHKGEHKVILATKKHLNAKESGSVFNLRNQRDTDEWCGVREKRLIGILFTHWRSYATTMFSQPSFVKPTEVLCPFFFLQQKTPDASQAETRRRFGLLMMTDRPIKVFQKKSASYFVKYWEIAEH